MAEVEKMTAAPPTDIPVSSPNASEAGGGSSSTAELGTSPNQEPSSNSHPHDSEYDTASDLEGGEDYDDDDDESGSEEDSETDEDDVGSETTEDDRHSGTVSGNDNCQDRSVADSEAQKKVDEDRSNPQYIPKRGTFYEHDDRTAETEGCLVPETENSSQVAPESNGDVNGVSASGTTPSGQPPAISQASKTMKQWQPASGGDRWSHDRFEASEQAPKSRSELMQSYGYDIRNEDCAPRARRRRRYTRGPSKYSRNWEDEQAYLKASNKERKPPRPQDFPALNERKPRGPRTSSFREEKENRRSERGADKPQGGGGGSAGGASGSNPAPRAQEVERERERGDRDREREPKNRNYGRVNGGPGRQNPMEFKPKSNRGPPPDRRERNERGERERERDREQEHVDQRNERAHQKPSTPRSNGQGRQSTDGPILQQSQQQPPQQQQPRQSPQQVQPPPLAAPQTQLSTTNLSQRLQQVQQRNDPSHVGSVQMHSLANQNQQQQQLQLTQQPQPAVPEPRTAPKRYSSLRRSQQEASQHLAEQQQQQQLQQQLHLQQQQQQQQQQQPSQIMIQDPHVLMQFAYQQQEIQAQLQTLQLGPAAATVPAPPKQHAPPAAAYPQAQAAPYYVTGTDPVPVPVPVQVPVSVTVPPASPYVNPASAAYLPTTPAAVAFAQAQTSVVTQPQPQPPAQAQPPAAVAGQAPPSMNFHQNYNTVGGTTYFVPPVQTTSRPAALPQRRPTNAIPILPPSEKHKARPGGLAGSNANQTTNAKEEGGHTDNIDHIIDNMFVQRPAFQPPATGEAAAAGAKEDVANSNPILPALAAAEQNLQPVPAVGQE
ncbi:protein CASC3 [Drosophila pseudoobscura]|uniref:Protein CASC3 n=1 Tax=Drosophila pseudoobscura pseudoobscura TaxID=46245 RepID=A0A6I8UMS7_DROPS|nr:protein CASC3 [Drosophila pseudoobscura]